MEQAGPSQEDSIAVIIHSESLNKSFRRHDALRGISLAVPEGSIYALIGANGAGKTTTIKTLLNILAPTSGRSTVLGVDSRRLSPREFSRIGYVSENQELPQRLTVGAYLDYLRPFYSTWDRSLEGALVAEFQLPLDRKIRDLSHGMRMKASLACALCYRPRLLVLDEPFSGLDPLVRDELMERLLQQADEMTVFLSSHELDEIEGSTTYVGYLENGRLLFQESMAGLSDRVREVRVTLGHDAQIPSGSPGNWINFSVTGNVLSFVDVGYESTALQASLNSLLKDIREVEAQPAALRSIFTALARSNRSRETAP
jgi:ABC-2 type transport system ATP-binding protein